MASDTEAKSKRPRGRPTLATGEKREYIRLCLDPDVREALKATGNASRTIDDLVRRYLIPNQPPAG